MSDEARCRCGNVCLQGQRHCQKCDWGASDDDEPVVVQKAPPAASTSSKLSCFTTCPRCQTSYRGTRCTCCGNTPQPPRPIAQQQCAKCKRPSERKYCTACYKATTRVAPQLTCEDCGTNIVFGKYCRACKDAYRASLPDVCQDCKTTRVDAHQKYCYPCVAKFKAPRLCKACGAQTRCGLYCDPCYITYKQSH